MSYIRGLAYPVRRERQACRMGASAGFTFRYDGLFGRFAGSWPRAALIAACTSRAAASMLRSRSNCSVIEVDPSELVDVISVTPAMRPNWRSSGVATDDAMVSGLAPGSPALTESSGTPPAAAAKRAGTVGDAPARAMATVRSVVADGRSMKGAERLMPSRDGLADGALRGDAVRQAVEREVDHRRRVEGQDLAEEQAADDRDAQRTAQLRPDAPCPGPAAAPRAAPRSSSS